MAERFRFFDSIDGEDERFYTADEFAEYFRQFIRNGIFTGGENLKVETYEKDMKISIKPGYAWIEGYLYKIEGEDLILEHSIADPNLNRIDRVVIRLDKTLENRYVKTFILKGAPEETPKAPELTRNDNIYELSLAQVEIIAGKSFIESYQITDERLDKTVCGITNHLCEQDITHLVTKLQFNEHKEYAATQNELGHVKAGVNVTIDEDGTINAKGGDVDSVNGKTGRVEIDVADIPNLNATRVILGRVEGYMGSMHGGVAIGNNITMPPSGNNALTVIGRNLNVGDSTIVLGTNSNVQNYGLSIGNQAHSENGGTVIGERSTASGLGSFLVGNNGEASGEWAFSLAGGKSINNNVGIIGIDGSLGTNKWIVPGAFTVQGTKNFEIPHPKPEKQSTHVIRHGAVESPTAGDTLYRYKVQANKDGDLVVIDLPDYFIWLNKNVQIFVTPQGHFGNGYGELNVETEQLKIHCQYKGEYNVLVIGTRNDDHQSVRDWDIKGVEREVGESWTGETYVFEVDEIIEVEEIKEVA